MARELPQPDRDRLSALSALVLLTYALLRVVALPTPAVELRLLGLAVRFEFNARVVLLSLAAALTAAGADWLIRSHPWRRADQPTTAHWVLPGLAALGVGALLARLPEGPIWWLGLGLAAALLIAVLVTEYVVVDDDDPRYDGAAVGLTALAYLLLAGALFTIRAFNLRATLAVPMALAASGAVAWRLLRLHAPRRPALAFALVIGALCTQLAWALLYWPLTPVRMALVLTLVAYVGTGLTIRHLRGELDRSGLIEFGAVGAIGLAVILLLA
jgi:hypothetical protein